MDNVGLLGWDKLNKTLASVNTRYLSLRSKFESFARQANDRLTAAGFHIKGIEMVLCLDEGFFLAKFANRTVRFQFDTAFGKSETLVGYVTCCLAGDFSVAEHSPLLSFKYDGRGETGFLNDDGDNILIDSDIGAMYIVLDVLYKSLCVPVAVR